MGYFAGTREGFRFTAESALPENSVITLGKLVGITRRPTAAGEEGFAYLGTARGEYVFTFTQAVAAGDAIGLTDGVPAPDASGTFGIALNAGEAGENIGVLVLA